jgi:ribonuclease R
VLVLKKLRLLNKIHEQDPEHHYHAVVTRVKNMGITFDIPELMLDGFLHISELDNDYFVYEERTLTLRGTRTQLNYSCGKPILVRLLSVNFITLDSKWELVSKQPRQATDKSAKKRRKRR